MEPVDILLVIFVAAAFFWAGYQRGRCLLLDEMLQRLDLLKKMVKVSRQVIELREIPDEKAREEVIEMFRKSGHKPLYYSDISEKLRLPLDQVLRICDQLEQEGKIGESTNSKVG